jgi:hypothetical protein
MKIKTRPDDADVLESDEVFQVNDWLAELRDEGRADSWDEDPSGAEENSHAKLRGDARAEPGDSRAEPRDGRTEPGDSRAEPRDGRAEPGDGGSTGPWQAAPTESQGDDRAETRGEGRLRPWDNGHAAADANGRPSPRDNGHAAADANGRPSPRDNGHAAASANGSARPRDNGRAELPRRGYPRPEDLAAVPATTPVASAQTTMRAVIGDELRLPIVWCEMASCISWFAHPAALGEADLRARAIDARWRLDAVGMLACPQCVQTAPDFWSPLPVAVWDREEAAAMSAQMADEPSAEVVASVARELSHDLRCPASNDRVEVGVASAWIAAVPADDVPQSDNGGTSDEDRHPTDDHKRPEGHPRPGRHRKRLAAKLTFAGH